MTTSESDFDAAKAVTDQLKGMDKERQERILRWVAEGLGLSTSVPATTNRSDSDLTQTQTAQSQRANRQLQQPEGKPADIKTFVDSKKPKSDVQFAAVVAYYYRFEAAAESRKETIDAQALQDASRLTGRRRPTSPRMTLNNAKNLGYLDSPERGLFSINSVGENLVAMTLPGGETDRPRKKGQHSRTRKTKKR